jgi:hypothetical protein
MGVAELQAAAKSTVRKPCARLKITWAGSAVDNAVVNPEPESKNRVSIPQQAALGLGTPKPWAFCMTESGFAGEPYPRLDTMCAMPEPDINKVQGLLVGWYGAGETISDADGIFSAPQDIRITWVPSPLQTVTVLGDRSYLEYPVDFTVTFLERVGAEYIPAKYGDGADAAVSVTGNAFLSRDVSLREVLSDIAGVSLSINKWSKPGAFVKIQALAPALKAGYDNDDIMSLSLLEETDGSVATLPVGAVSANELSVTLQNVDDAFTNGNKASRMSTVARANRRIDPEIGFGDETYPKGVYWSDDWNVEIYGAEASTVARDRLGLLQDISYSGMQGDDAAAEATVWRNKSLYNIADDLLNYLRNTYMLDLEYALDDGLKGDIIPLGFFTSQSYFDCIKDIAAAGLCFAYMDTPTIDEIADAASRGNIDCADILRIRKLKNIYPDPEMDRIRATYTFTLDDLEAQQYRMKRSSIANIVAVPYSPYELVDGEAKKPEDIEELRVVLTDEISVREYGKAEFEMAENQMIQTQAQAQRLAETIVGWFSGQQIEMEIGAFGDVTLDVGDIVIIPEYVKRGNNARGYYAITRINTEFSGGLRQTLTCRRVGDADGDEFIEFTVEGELVSFPPYAIRLPQEVLFRWNVITPGVTKVTFRGETVPLSGTQSVYVDETTDFMLYAYIGTAYRGWLKLTITVDPGIDLSPWIWGSFGPPRPVPIIPVPPDSVWFDGTRPRGELLLSSVSGSFGAPRPLPDIPDPNARPDRIWFDGSRPRGELLVASIIGNFGAPRPAPDIPDPNARPDRVWFDGTRPRGELLLNSVSGNFGLPRPAPDIPDPNVRPDRVWLDEHKPMGELILSSIYGSIG